jgi:hypothetical protein
VYWDGGYSRCHVGRDIESYVQAVIRKHSLPISFVFSKSDGFLGDAEYRRLCSQLGRSTEALTGESWYMDLEAKKVPGTFPIVGCLCSREFARSNLVYLPLDDATFRDGLESVLAPFKKPAWNDRKPIAFWRGGSSGHDRPTLRVKIATALASHPNADVRITAWGGWENEQSIPPELFGARCDLGEHFKYKYILIVDGNCIASNHQWVFGSGAVPIMVTHPSNVYWFQKHLVPMVNYVPIAYDLSNLTEMIDFLVANDDKAKQIAEAAQEFARTVFSPTFQRKHIDDEIARVVYGSSSSELVARYKHVARTPSDINEHIDTLYRYAKQCTSIVECGVREIVSSYAFASGLIGTAGNSLTMIDLYSSTKMPDFLEMCHREGVNASFVLGSDISCPLIETDMLFIDTWHVYGHLKRELAYWHASVRKFIILHDTTVDEVHGEAIRGGANTAALSRESGYPEIEIRTGLGPAIAEFLVAHPEWVVEHKYTHNNGLTVLARR